MKALLIVLCLFLLASCSTYKFNKSEPFAVHNREGKYPTKKNVPVKHKKTWSFRQYGHEGR